MPITISKAFNIKHERLMKAGAFDVCLDFDARMFIDPAMLAVSKCPELKGARNEIVLHFNKVITLLEKSKMPNDKMWRSAENLLAFPEIKELCIGYSVSNTMGSGIGRGNAEKLVTGAKEIMDAGVHEPEIFELAGLFEEGIGPDRISDMIGGLLADRLAKFTVRICKKFQITCKTKYKTTTREYKVPRNPQNSLPLLMVPHDILSELPLALDRGSIGDICLHNRAVRDSLNATIGKGWKVRELTKQALREVFLKNPDALQDLIKRYRNTSVAPYDFDEDPASIIRWAWVQNIIDAAPLKLAKPKKPNLDEVHEIVLKICEHFATILEDNGINELLFVGDKPRPERYAQRLFFSVADSYCTANDLDLSPESNAGRGPVDFKVSVGAKAKCVVELKLSRNSKLLQGYEKQLPTYAASEKARRSIYLVVNLGRKTDKAPMKRLEEADKNAPPPKPVLVVAQAKLKKSASKL
jgi:hypothetical protein